MSPPIELSDLPVNVECGACGGAHPVEGRDCRFYYRPGAVSEHARGEHRRAPDVRCPDCRFDADNSDHLARPAYLEEGDDA